MFFNKVDTLIYLHQRQQKDKRRKHLAHPERIQKEWDLNDAQRRAVALAKELQMSKERDVESVGVGLMQEQSGKSQSERMDKVHEETTGLLKTVKKKEMKKHAGKKNKTERTGVKNSGQSGDEPQPGNVKDNINNNITSTQTTLSVTTPTPSTQTSPQQVRFQETPLKPDGPRKSE